jgi:predicted tellurium resistance membrane protein TerC
MVVVMDALKMRKKKRGVVLGWIVAAVLRSGLIILGLSQMLDN